MLSIMLLAAATVAQPIDRTLDELDTVCGYGVESIKSPETDAYALYRGRIETRMDDLHFSDEKKEDFRFMCKIYLRGAGKGLVVIESMNRR